MEEQATVQWLSSTKTVVDGYQKMAEKEVRQNRPDCRSTERSWSHARVEGEERDRVESPQG